MPYIDVAFILAAYLIGSLSSAILVCRLMNLPDPRTTGSHNPGTTNVLRIGGKLPAILTLLGDVLKGVFPVIIAKMLGLSAVFLSFILFGAFLGHLYPLYFKFKGGKGVATALGSLIALSLPLGLSLIAIWLLTAIIFRYSSLAALTAALCAPGLAYYFTLNLAYLLTVSFMSGLLIYRHRTNILQLIAGTENKIGKKL